jgi:hypothetical protein
VATPAERKALNQHTFREANDGLERGARETIGVEPDGLVPFLCECPRETCLQVVLVTLQEYQRVRQDSTLGIESIGHDDEMVENVVDRTERFVVTQKFGEAAQVVEELDARGDG